VKKAFESRAFAAIHDLDAARWKVGALPPKCKEALAQGSSGSGVNLLKSGMITPARRAA